MLRGCCQQPLPLFITNVLAEFLALVSQAATPGLRVSYGRCYWLPTRAMRTLRSAGHQTHRPSRSHLYQDSLPFLCRWMSCPCGQLADRRGNLIFLGGDGGEALSFNNRHRMEMGTPPRGRAATRADKTTGATSPAFGLRHADPAPPRRSEATTRRRGSTQSPRPSSLSLWRAHPGLSA